MFGYFRGHSLCGCRGPRSETAMTPPRTFLLSTQSDRRLVALVREGHELAFAAIVERYRRALLRYSRRLVGDARAEDVVQQTFVNAWGALSDRGDEVRDLKPWLYRIAHNTAVTTLRAKGHDAVALGDLEVEGPQLELERRAALHETLTALARLPERQRDALVRTAIEGQSQLAVAESLGVSEGTVRQLVFRARSALRAAATAVTPAPLARSIAGSRASDVPLAERVGELVAATGTAGFGVAALTKSAAVVAVVGGLGTGLIDGADPTSADGRTAEQQALRGPAATEARAERDAPSMRNERPGGSATARGTGSTRRRGAAGRAVERSSDGARRPVATPPAVPPPAGGWDSSGRGGESAPSVAPAGDGDATGDAVGASAGDGDAAGGGDGDGAPNSGATTSESVEENEAPAPPPAPAPAPPAGDADAGEGGTPSGGGSEGD